jgi:hypothetical protein
VEIKLGLEAVTGIKRQTDGHSAPSFLAAQERSRSSFGNNSSAGMQQEHYEVTPPTVRGVAITARASHTA